jgi:anaerobic ribonucleoside-triphosphate reductase activating protein
MRIAGTVQDSIVDGPGFRFTVFTQGCPHHCEGCHNPETHDPSGGSEMTVEELVKQLYSNPLTDGLTLSGGEPFMQPGDCARLAQAAKDKGLNIWTYTGYTFERLLSMSKTTPEIMDLLKLTDVLVDGPFVLAERSLSIKWRGSRNQRLIDVKRSLAEGKPVELV